MEKILEILKKFAQENDPMIIVNTSTNKALLCLKPEFTAEEGRIFMRFESLAEKGGNSIYIINIQEKLNDALYVENEQDNVLMLKRITLNNYKHYIQPSYTNTPDFTDLQTLIKHIDSQL